MASQGIVHWLPALKIQRRPARHAQPAGYGAVDADERTLAGEDGLYHRGQGQGAGITRQAGVDDWGRVNEKPCWLNGWRGFL